MHLTNAQSTGCKIMDVVLYNDHQIIIIKNRIH